VEYTVVFWDTVRDYKTIRYIRGLMQLLVTSDMCALISEE
jgi:hypothetical protein